MKSYLVVVFVLLLVVCHGQKKGSVPPPPPPGPNVADVTVNAGVTLKPCGFKKINNAKQLHGKFPFSKSKTILVISFDNPNTDPYVMDADGKLQPRPKNPLYRDTLGYNSVHEVRAVSEKEGDQLALLFYSFNCNSPKESYGCYNPRNAILFMDEKGKVIAAFEICFECHNYELRPKPFYTGEMCNCKYDELKDFFRKAGITYGIVGKN